MSYFKKYPKIQYEGPKSDNDFAFKQYNPSEKVDGKTMKEHLRFAVAYWHTFTEDGKDPFGVGTIQRPWDHYSSMDLAKARVEGSFEFFEKMNVPFFCFHDIDIAPEGDNLAETFKNLDIIVSMIKDYMKTSNTRLLWNTMNMFTHPRFMHGAATSNEVDIYAHASAKVKKGIEIGKELGADNYVFWGGREGYESLLNTDMKFELDNLARFYEMAIAYKKDIGFDAQFLIEPKPKEPTKHQYDFDAATTHSFLKNYGLDKHFKLNIEANHATLAGHTFEHELRTARIHGMLGSVDANQGDLLLGWDTDEFPSDLYSAILSMYEVLENGGLGKGGLNFDAKVRRSSYQLDDLLYAHITGMDTFATGLKIASQLRKDSFFKNIINDRYSSFDSELGQKIVNGQTDFYELEQYALNHDFVEHQSGRLELIKSKINQYILNINS